MRRLAAIALSVMALAFAGCASKAPALYEIEGRWVQEKKFLHPAATDYIFNSMAVTPSFGVVVLGDSLVLRISNGRPYVTLGWQGFIFKLYPPHYSVAELDSKNLVFAGSATESDAKHAGHEELFAESNVLVTVRNIDGTTKIIAGPPRPPETGRWGPVDIVSADPGELLAVLTPSTQSLPNRQTVPHGSPRVLDRIFRFDGNAWHEFATPPGGPYLALGTPCRDPDGSWWLGGAVLGTDGAGLVNAKSGYVARFANGAWRELTPPEPRVRHLAWTTHAVICGPQGPWIAAQAIRNPERINSWLGDDSPVLYRYVRGEWSEIELPAIRPNADGAKPERFGVGSPFVDRDGRFWMTFWRETRDVTDPIYSFDGETWTTHELPTVPGVKWYGLHGIAFDDNGNGWTIANLGRSAVRPEGTGILLRFRDGKWQLQNWTWPFWRQRGFGLLP